MPLIETSTYDGPPLLQKISKHFQTIIPSFRKVADVAYQRERINTADGDFIDVDTIDNNSKNLVVITHGFEGNSHKQYAMGAAKIFSEDGWDVAAWNCRSCSGEMNRVFRMYDHAEIDDISLVVNHFAQKKNYDSIVLVGYSMGGNICLRYGAYNAHEKVKKIIAFSAPLDMKDSLMMLTKRSSFVYRRHFLSNLAAKIAAKALMFPDKLSVTDLDTKDWIDKCAVFFCKVNGYTSMEEFYKRASPNNFLDKIKIPTLIVNALNDPFLGKKCYPFDMVKNLKNVFLETPASGGHCGFISAKDKIFAWSERRALAFAMN